MTRNALLTIFLLTSSSPALAGDQPQAGSVQTRPTSVTTTPIYTPPPPGLYTNALPTGSIDAAIAQWRQLRQSDSFTFASYAGFLLSNPGFPGEAGLRRNAEKAMRPGENPAQVIAFFRNSDPTSGNGWARLADSYLAVRRSGDALNAARSAWASASLSAADEANLQARFGAQFTSADHDRRVDALLFDKQPSNAQRLLGWTSPSRRDSFAARIAMLQRSVDAETLFARVANRTANDAGLLMDRARYLRDGNNEPAARLLAARPHAFTERPADVERWYDMLVILARGAAADRQWASAYDIARQLDDAMPAGIAVSSQSYGIRDNYTTLAWLAGTAALTLGRANDAARMFERYANGGRSLQVASKGYYWAGQAAIRAGRPADATRYFDLAAKSPELFYSQLALERLGRAVPTPRSAPAIGISDAQRRAFLNRPLVAAVQRLWRSGSRSDQALFVRALAESLETEQERIMATELAAAIGRQDLAVWTARASRNSGDAFYYRAAFPTHAFAASRGRLWSLVHGITRQESSFDRSAVSHANAHGLMQILPSTGREQAGKMGLSFETGRLTSDPAYNVMLGSAYFQRLLDRWGGSYPLAVASYNAGAGNVNKWVRANGDPRTSQIDIVSWIEKIPFEETRGYVQRVLENSVVYDTLNPTAPPPAGAVHLSTYLGKSGRPG